MRSTAELRCLCGRRHQIDASATATAEDRRGELVPLADGYGPLSGSTLARWAREGRLRAWRADRGRLVAWTRDVVAAVEAEPAGGSGPTALRVQHDVVAEMLADPSLEASC